MSSFEPTPCPSCGTLLAGVIGTVEASAAHRGANENVIPADVVRHIVAANNAERHRLTDLLHGNVARLGQAISRLNDLRFALEELNEVHAIIEVILLNASRQQ
jgi:hypothetical protein